MHHICKEYLYNDICMYMYIHRYIGRYIDRKIKHVCVCVCTCIYINIHIYKYVLYWGYKGSLLIELLGCTQGVMNAFPRF